MSWITDFFKKWCAEDKWGTHDYKYDRTERLTDESWPKTSDRVYICSRCNSVMVFWLSNWTPRKLVRGGYPAPPLSCNEILMKKVLK